MMNRDSNEYTFLFAAIMVLVVASTLAFTASSLKSLQADNVRKEKMQNILSTIGIHTDREQAETLYKQYITGTLALDHMGNADQTVDAFQLKLNYEIKKPANEQRFPLYKAIVDGVSYYIIPLRGSGLWDSGFICSACVLCCQYAADPTTDAKSIAALALSVRQSSHR